MNREVYVLISVCGIEEGESGSCFLLKKNVFDNTIMKIKYPRFRNVEVKPWMRNFP